MKLNAILINLIIIFAVFLNVSNSFFLFFFGLCKVL